MRLATSRVIRAKARKAETSPRRNVAFLLSEACLLPETLARGQLKPAPELCLPPSWSTSPVSPSPLPLFHDRIKDLEGGVSQEGEVPLGGAR